MVVADKVIVDKNACNVRVVTRDATRHVKGVYVLVTVKRPDTVLYFTRRSNDLPVPSTVRD